MIYVFMVGQTARGIGSLSGDQAGDISTRLLLAKFRVD
jgi:hypothetical protein